MDWDLFDNLNEAKKCIQNIFKYEIQRHLQVVKDNFYVTESRQKRRLHRLDKEIDSREGCGVEKLPNFVSIFVEKEAKLPAKWKIRFLPGNGSIEKNIDR